jgi:hypothetical protein
MVSDYLNQDINSLMTLRETLKICVDKFIAHNDTMVYTTAEGDMVCQQLFGQKR